MEWGWPFFQGRLVGFLNTKLKNANLAGPLKLTSVLSFAPGVKQLQQFWQHIGRELNGGLYQISNKNGVVTDLSVVLVLDKVGSDSGRAKIH